MRVEEAHRLAREKGTSGPLYLLARVVLTPLMRGWFRVRISGREHIPAAGAAIIAPNHKSFLDSFFVGLATPRPVRFMGKAELFERPWGGLLARLGAFPVRRGESDADALATARSILAAGELLAIFPEGTRVREPAALGSPRRGAGRFALESGAPLVPAAITGTDHLWLGPLPRPRRVQLAFAPPIRVGEIASGPEDAGRLVEEVLWPEVEGEFERLRGRRGVVAAAVAAVGLGAIALRQRRRASSRRIPLGGGGRPGRRSLPPPLSPPGRRPRRRLRRPG